MPDYDPKTIAKGADPNVIAGFKKALIDRKASGKVALALFEAGIVEANLKNPTGGDRDSVGSLQQRDNGAWGTLEERMDPYQAALKFVDKAIKAENDFVTAGQLAQFVQVSGFPLRYDQAKAAAEYVIRNVVVDEINNVGEVASDPAGAIGGLVDKLNPWDNIRGFLETIGMRILYFVGGLMLLILGGIVLVNGGTVGAAVTTASKVTKGRMK